jgi:hypothetical protein
VTTLPEYFRIDGCDRNFFRCERMRATLSVESCAANWRAGNDQHDERRSSCRSCPIGAAHAGEEQASLSPIKGTLICSRCHRMSSRGWLIGKWLCVSCWNREREWVRGRNAKGNRPSKMPRLDPRSVRIVEAGEPRTIYRQLTQSSLELVVGALRDCRGTVAFTSNPNAAAQFPQLRLF